MNLLDCVVTKVLSEPKHQNNKWIVSVEYDCYGVISQTPLFFNTEEEAKKVKPHYIFLG